MTFFILCNIAFAENYKKITLQLSWLNQFQFAGYYVAKEKGYYKKLGLDVEIKEFSNNNLVDAVENKEVDFAVGRSSLLLDKINKKDVVALAAIYQHSPMMLLVLKESNINSVKELIHKKIMITEDAKNMASIMAMLTANKLKENDLYIQNHTFNLDDLINKKTDAMASYLSNEPIRLKQKGIEYKIFHPKDYGFDFYNDILFTSREYIDKNPKIVKAFYEASIKGWEYAFSNVVETSELIYEKYNTQNKTLINLIKEGEVLKSIVYDKNGKIGSLDIDRLKDIVNVFKVLGLTSSNKDFDYDSFIYESNLNKKFVLKLDYDEKNLIVLSLTFFILLIIIVIYFLTKIKVDNDLLESVINGTEDLIYYKDKNFKYIGCNEAFEKFVGKPKSQIIGKRIDEVIMDKELSSTLSDVSKNVLKGKSSEIVNEWVVINKKKIYLQTKKTPFMYTSRDMGVLGVSRDLTKLKHLEEENLSQQKTLLTHSKISAMSEMLGNIAHQWRQPLSVITTNVSALKLSIDLGDELTNERVSECAEVVVSQAKYLSKTVDDFTSFFSSSIKEVKEFNIKDTLCNMEKIIKDAFSNEGIEYIKKYEDCIIEHNENILIQAFMNICNNARDAIVQNSEKNKRYFFITVEKGEKSVEIIFKDSGGGINPEIIDKLFEPYFTTKHQALGTGIGLYMSHQIITKHFNGTIIVRNVNYIYNDKNLVGAEFIINIPI